MSVDPLHQFRSREYDRSNQKWICGAESCGLPCPLGPSHRGQCRAICTPVKEGDRYYCNNASELLGDCDAGPLPDGQCCQVPAQCKPQKQGANWTCTRGRCSAGPLPSGECNRSFAACVPTRSVLSKRRLTVVAVLAGTVGLLLILTMIPQRDAIVSAGTLTSHHSTVATCEDCHIAASADVHDWLPLATGELDLQSAQSSGCLECHQEELGANALLAHGLDVTTLREMSESANAASAGGVLVSLVDLARRQPPDVHDQHDCAKCHVEHRGADFDLKHMSNMQCQTCHASMFESFQHGHPEFSQYPYSRRSRIYFDHLSHFGNHFQDSRFGSPAPQNCSSCHFADEAAGTMLVKGYEETCLACHESQIQNTDVPGVPFFAVPALDLDTLENASLNIGQWPSAYPMHVTAAGNVSAFTRVLFGWNSEFLLAAEKLEELNLDDLSDSSQEQLTAVADFAWTFKQALYELRFDGRVEFENRLSESLGGGPLRPAMANSFYEEIVSAQQRWFPNLAAEVMQRRETEGSPLPDQTSPADHDSVAEAEAVPADPEATASAGAGWYRRDLDLSLRYRAAEHADKWLKLWLERSAAESGGAAGRQGSAGVMQGVFNSLAQPNAPGRCMKCHTADQQPDGALQPQWHARPDSSLASRITRFDHRPHVVTAGAENCRSCHPTNAVTQFDVQSIFRSEFFHSNWAIQTDSTHFNSDFGALDKADCARCHKPEAAGDDCLTCHYYHAHR